MFCSTIIPTIGRSSLSRAVYSVLNQDITSADFEVIVVNDSGQPLPKADWQLSERLQILNTNKHERCVARNAGAAIARGEYLHFLDDDDWLLPDALTHFWQAATASRADWLHGDTQLVDRTDQPIIKLSHQNMNGNRFIHTMAGEWVPLQASLIKTSAFFKLGGFNPHIPGAEDIDLARRITLHSDMVSIPATVACVEMGEENSATNYTWAAKAGRWAREAILDETGVLDRLVASADSSYWYGRIVRLYLTSAFWNLKRRRIFPSVSRLLFGLTGFILANYRIISNHFWQAVTKQHESEAFLQGFAQANLPVERRDI